jgi:uncharacterized protein (TIGR03435 family)
VNAFIGPSGRYVIDRASLAGNWDWELTFATQAEAPDRTRRPPIRTRRTSSSQSMEQLGLKLEPTKDPVEVLVIDSIERPSED